MPVMLAFLLRCKIVRDMFLPLQVSKSFVHTVQRNLALVFQFASLAGYVLYLETDLVCSSYVIHRFSGAEINRISQVGCDVRELLFFDLAYLDEQVAAFNFVQGCFDLSGNPFHVYSGILKYSLIVDWGRHDQILLSLEFCYSGSVIDY